MRTQWNKAKKFHFNSFHEEVEVADNFQRSYSIESKLYSKYSI